MLVQRLTRPDRRRGIDVRWIAVGVDWGLSGAAGAGEYSTVVLGSCIALMSSPCMEVRL
jgi:hypothetical protein